MVRKRCKSVSGQQNWARASGDMIIQNAKASVDSTVSTDEAIKQICTTKWKIKTATMTRAKYGNLRLSTNTTVSTKEVNYVQQHEKALSK